MTKEEIWNTRIADRKSSGLSVREWCKKNEISVSTYTFWSKRLDTSGKGHTFAEREAFWYNRVMEYRNSGVSIKQWCKENGFVYSTFRTWVARFRNKDGITSDAQRYNREYWKKKILEYKESGKSLVEWCREQGVSYRTYHYWVNRLSKDYGKVPGTRSNYWYNLIQEYKNSDKTVKEWCDEHGVNINTFNFWLCKLNMGCDNAATIKNRRLWQERIAECENSGMTAIDWCKLNDISINSYNYWVRKFGFNVGHHLGDAQVWLDRIKRCKESGISVVKWCEENSVSYGAYYYWMRRLKELGLLHK